MQKTTHCQHTVIMWVVNFLLKCIKITLRSHLRISLILIISVLCAHIVDHAYRYKSRSRRDNPNCAQRSRNSGVVISRSIGRSFLDWTSVCIEIARLTIRVKGQGNRPRHCHRSTECNLAGLVNIQKRIMKLQLLNFTLLFFLGIFVYLHFFQKRRMRYFFSYALSLFCFMLYLCVLI